MFFYNYNFKQNFYYFLLFKYEIIFFILNYKTLIRNNNLINFNLLI